MTAQDGDMPSPEWSQQQAKSCAIAYYLMAPRVDSYFLGCQLNRKSGVNDDKPGNALLQIARNETPEGLNRRIRRGKMQQMVGRFSSRQRGERRSDPPRTSDFWRTRSIGASFGFRQKREAGDEGFEPRKSVMAGRSIGAANKTDRSAPCCIRKITHRLAAG